jgi:hypothetical protein
MKTELLKDIEKRMQEHDWFYEMSDMHQVYLRGEAQRQAIIILLRQVPGNSILPLVDKLVPESLRTKFLYDLVTYRLKEIRPLP